MDNYISWNVANWITVLLMVSIGMAAIGVVTAFVKNGLPTAKGMAS